MMAPLVTVDVRNVSKTFGSGDQAVQAVREATFVASHGELIALVGPSGSGKTTLLAMLGGLLTPSAGSLTVGGVDLAAVGAAGLSRFRREKVGFVFQGYNLLPYLTARRNLQAVVEITGGDRRAARELVDRLLEEMGLTDRADAYPAEMSGGERQRVAIARALMNNPALILLDEPTANIDTARGRQVVEMLVAEVKHRDKTALMVTHDQRMAEYATRILYIEDGVVTEQRQRAGRFMHQ
jgi:putative ABC transport system ATP-binding protein